MISLADKDLGEKSDELSLATTLYKWAPFLCSAPELLPLEQSPGQVVPLTVLRPAGRSFKETNKITISLLQISHDTDGNTWNLL